MKIILYLLLVISIVSCNRRSKNIPYSVFVDNVKTQADSLKLENGVFTLKQKIDFIKTENSIRSYRLTDDSIFILYDSLFWKHFQNNFKQELEFESYVGMSDYSKKYDLLLGLIAFDRKSCVFIDYSSLPEKYKEHVNEYLKLRKDDASLVNLLLK